MIIDGPISSQTIDSSGEILHIEGLDISDFNEGRAFANFEHLSSSPDVIVGKFLMAKKILKKEDCDSDRQRMFWDKIKTPFVYGMCELFDKEGHVGAIGIAAMIRYFAKRKEPIMLGFSVEGQTLQREENNLIRTLARRAAITLRPCNKQCWVDMISDADMEKIKKSLDNDLLKNLPEVDSVIVSDDAEYSFLELKKAADDLNKTLTAGVGNVAPAALSGGAALVREDISGRTARNRVKAAVRDWDRKRPLKEAIKAALPEVGEGFIDHFIELANELTLKKSGKPIDMVRIGSEHSANPSQDDDQKKLIEGLFLDKGAAFNPPHNQAGSSTLLNVRNDAGQDVIVKVPHSDPKGGLYGDESKNAVQYYQIGKFLGLGDHMPVINSFTHPDYNKTLQAIEMKHKMTTPLQSKRQYEKAAHKARESGQLHKLAMLDMLLGNVDRHSANVMFNNDGHFLHIDNDTALNHDVYRGPHYLYGQGEFEGISEDPIQPDAKRWLDSINPRALAKRMAEIGVDPEVIKRTVAHLRLLQEWAKQGHTVGNMDKMLMGLKGEGHESSSS